MLLLSGHQQTAAKMIKSNPVQLLLPENTLAMASRNKFLTDMCYILIVTNIPFNKQKKNG